MGKTDFSEEVVEERDCASTYSVASSVADFREVGAVQRPRGVVKRGRVKEEARGRRSRRRDGGESLMMCFNEDFMRLVRYYLRE